MDEHEGKQVGRSAHPVRIYRTAMCMSQGELAAAAGVSRLTVIRLEAGESPSLKTANAVAHALDVDRAALFPPKAPAGDST